MTVSPPLLTVVGNCQAESTRRLLMSTGAFTSDRIKPIHEIEASDLGWFTALLKRTDVLVTQPIRDDYRGVPVGTRQMLEHLPRHARHITVPVLRFDGLMPYHAIIRNPEDTSENPPVVPYHDLRILAAAARGARAPLQPDPSPDALRRAAAMSIEQIATRERAHNTVVISDYLETTPVWHTINHPDNATLGVMAQRIVDALGIDAQVELPDYEMLGQLQAGVDKQSALALGVNVERPEWRDRTLGTIDAGLIAREQLEYYRQRPHVVAHGLERHRERLENLGLMP